MKHFSLVLFGFISNLSSSADVNVFALNLQVSKYIFLFAILPILLLLLRIDYDVAAGYLGKSQVKQKFGKLIIGKTTSYAAGWLYRLLMRNCLNDEQ